MKKTLLTTLMTFSMLSVGGHALSQTTDNTTKPLPSMVDNAPVVLTGTVGEVRKEEFDLNYGTNKITVELDRFGWDGNEAKYLIPGESVTVSGYIDDDFFEGREIEAYNIRLNDSYVYYYTTDAYPTYYYVYDADAILEDGTFVTMRGNVSEISEDEFTVTNAKGSMQVDVSKIGYDPFDDVGLQKIEKGDKVYVYGQIDSGFFDTNEIMADGVIELTSR